MIEPEQTGLSVVRQCELVSISRSGFYYRPAGETPLNLMLMRLIDGAIPGNTIVWFASNGPSSPARGLYGRPQTGATTDGQDRAGADLPAAANDGPHPEHRIHPYLLRDLVIDRPNQVWCADITYIPMRRGFLYLQDHGRGVLHRGAGRGLGTVWPP